MAVGGWQPRVTRYTPTPNGYVATSAAAPPSTTTPVLTKASTPPSVLIPRASRSMDKMNVSSLSKETCQLDGCLAQYCRGPIPNFIDAEVVAPWVKVVFGTYKNTPDPLHPVFLDEPDITVGNKPSPQYGNLAYVKSFEYQLKDGNTCKIEIIDQQGGAFATYAERLPKCAAQLQAAKSTGDHGADPAGGRYFLQVQWGWTVQVCEGEPVQQVASPVITFLNQTVQINYQGGLVRYTVNGVDLMQVSFMTRAKGAWGSGTSPATGGVPIKNALRYLFCEGAPSMCTEFVDKETAVAQKPDSQAAAGATKRGEWAFESTDYRSDANDGIYYAWQAQTQAKLSAAGRWTNSLRDRSDQSGHLYAWDNTNDQPCVLVYKDPTPGCKAGDIIGEHDYHLGTYVVNGGPKSNVLNFTTNLNFIGGFALRMQGGTTGHPSAAMLEAGKDACKAGSVTGEGSPPDPGEGRTIATQGEPTVHAIAYGKDQETQNRCAMEAITANKKAGAIYANIQPIEAELTLQGNPDRRFCDNRIRGAAWVAIVVVNPFYLDGQVGRDGVDDVYWHIGPSPNAPGVLDMSNCNQILSNPNWQILGCTHSIREGSYHTTLHLRLLAPGFDVASGSRVGGDPKVGWDISADMGEYCSATGALAKAISREGCSIEPSKST